MKEWIVVLRAADTAARWHVHQRRKGIAQEPYINHLLEVASLVSEATSGSDPTLVIAARRCAVQTPSTQQRRSSGQSTPLRLRQKLQVSKCNDGASHRLPSGNRRPPGRAVPPFVVQLTVRADHEYVEPIWSPRHHPGLADDRIPRRGPANRRDLHDRRAREAP